MARTKITAYVTSDIADALKRVAKVKDRSISDVVEEAIAQRFLDTGREAEHAVLLARLDTVMRRLGVIEKAQETHFELTAHAARFAMSIAPEIHEADRIALNARGADRFRNLLASIVNRLAGGRSTWRETLAALPDARAAATPGATAS